MQNTKLLMSIGGKEYVDLYSLKSTVLTAFLAFRRPI